MVELPSYTQNKIINTLRQKQGDKIKVFDGQNEFVARITELKSRKIIVLVEHEQITKTESILDMHLFQCILKNDNMDLVIQKVTELGAFEFTPVLSKYSVVKVSQNKIAAKMEHWFHISRHAAEQSGRLKLLKLNHPIQLEQLFYLDKATDRFVLEPKGQCRFSELKKIKKKVSIVCGPEKGFDKMEIQSLNKSGFKSIQLGPRTLRAETAAITAISGMQTIWGDL